MMHGCFFRARFKELDVSFFLGRYGETKKSPPKQTEHCGILCIVEVKAMFCWGDPSRVRNYCVVIRVFG